MLKRVLLFALTNLLVIITISFILNLLGIGYGISAAGIDYSQLMIFCLVWGVAGSFISLQLSRWMAKMSMRIQLIDANSGGELGWLYNRVAQISQAAGLPTVPEIGVYESPEVNAFATGPSKKRSLVAFSSGLLQRMDRDEIEGVAAHEIAHIANGDMVTMTLLQGIINAFVMFLARVIAFAIAQAGRSSDREGVVPSWIIVVLLEITLSILGSMVVYWFSRHREFKADAGSASYVGREKMIAALKRLQRNQELALAEGDPQSFNTMKISGGKSWLRLFASHPPLEDRIAALQLR